MYNIKGKQMRDKKEKERNLIQYICEKSYISKIFGTCPLPPPPSAIQT
jgi:hypothetical protein